ncbi:MAG: tandem-95 repeat protein, partial [Candidatus Thermoplasmatota archaeon]
GPQSNAAELYTDEDTDLSIDAATLFSKGWTSIVCSESENISFSESDGILTFTPAQDWYGTEQLLLTAYYIETPPIPPPPPDLSPCSSGSGDEMNVVIPWLVQVNLTVFPVNDPPVVLSTPRPILVQGGAAIPALLALSEYFFDVDGDMLSFTAASLFGGVSPSVDGSILGITVSREFAGLDHLQIIASDWEYTVSMIVDVHIGAPVELQMNEDSPLTAIAAELTPYPSHTIISAEVVSHGDMGTAYAAQENGTWTIHLQGARDWSGVAYVTVALERFIPINQPVPMKTGDGDAVDLLPGYTVVEYISIEAIVLAVNDPPYVTVAQPIVLSTLEDVPLYSALDLREVFADVDTPITFGFTGGEAHLYLSDPGTLSVIPSQNFQGTVLAVLTASDGEYEAQCSLIIEVQGIDDLIVPLAGNDVVIISEDQMAVINLTEIFYDVEGVLGYAVASTENCSVEIDQINRTALIQPVQDWNGKEVLGFSAFDAQSMAEKKISMVVLPVNDAPVLLSTIPQLTTEEDSSISVNLARYFADVDSQIAYAFSSSAPALSLSLNDGVLSLVPAANWAGSSTIKISAFDGDAMIATSSEIIVLAVNDPPSLMHDMEPVEIPEDSTAHIQLRDIIGDVDSTLSYIGQGSEIGVSISDAGIAHIAPAQDWYGSTTIQITASDGEYAMDLAIPVHVAPVNDPPQLAERVPGIRIERDATTAVNLAPFLSDVDGDPLSFSAQGAGGIGVEVSEHTLTLDATGVQPGTYTIEVTASDGTESCIAQVDVFVASKAAVAAEAGLPMSTAYALSGGLMLTTALAVAGFALLAKDMVRRRVADRKRVLTATH